MLKIKQTIIVEGRYDKSKLSSLVDATIITTDGFDIFRDKEKLAMIRALADKNGLIILTDSDVAGFRIRSHIAGAVDPAKITHVYTPDIFGKESRKAKAGAEGKLGVEGIPAQILLDAFARAGITAQDNAPAKNVRPVTRADLVEWGLSGGDNSFALRQRVLKQLKLPERMNAKAMLNVINSLYTYEEFVKLLE